jgi:ABC-type lipoprotein release transport system permease subunit
MLVQAPDTTRVFDRIVCGVDSSPESLEAARQADRLRSLAPIVAVNVTGGQSSWNDLAVVVPWVNLGITFGAVYLAALLATLAPAPRASRAYPAEALRYE